MSNNKLSGVNNNSPPKNNCIRGRKGTNNFAINNE